ncbi:flagellar biosynthetic protein FliR [Dongshaea marina]|uniref:flagellar biosynthetic protein FliR n=1 Tax=Dongshaea marina TaxID=2047966 RepID=UPI00190112FB|nr:flagellar biosynthetic protein FliR [Dongshaea marina]
MLTLSFAQLSAMIGQLWWPFFRILAALLAMPLFGSKLVTRRLRILLALSLAVVIYPFMPAAPAIDPFSIAAIGLTLQQLLIGALFGLSLLLFFTIFTLAGQMVSMQMGLSMAAMNDPVNGVSVPILGQIYQAAIILLFFLFNGHLLALKILIESFHYLPIGGPLLSPQHLMQLPHMAGWMFGAALLLVLPAIVAMLLVNIAFGLMYRAAPQLNIYSLGFPMTIILGVVILALTFDNLPDNFGRLLSLLLRQLNQLMGPPDGRESG